VQDNLRQFRCRFQKNVNKDFSSDLSCTTTPQSQNLGKN